jgi:hypothetical protein
MATSNLAHFRGSKSPNDLSTITEATVIMAFFDELTRPIAAELSGTKPSYWGLRTYRIASFAAIAMSKEWAIWTRANKTIDSP